jgi:hypothetical protein
MLFDLFNDFAAVGQGTLQLQVGLFFYHGDSRAIRGILHGHEQYVSPTKHRNCYIKEVAITWGIRCATSGSISIPANTNWGTPGYWTIIILGPFRIKSSIPGDVHQE